MREKIKQGARRFQYSDIPDKGIDKRESVDIWCEAGGVFLNPIDLACAVKVLISENTALRARVEELEAETEDLGQAGVYLARQTATDKVDLEGRIAKLKAMAHKEYTKTGPETGSFHVEPEPLEPSPAFLLEIAKELEAQAKDPDEAMLQDGDQMLSDLQGDIDSFAGIRRFGGK